MSVITPYQRNLLLSADRSRDVEVVRQAVEQVTLDNPFATLLDIEMVFRDAAATTFLVLDKDSAVCIAFGMANWKKTLLHIAKEIDVDTKFDAAVSANHARLLQPR